MAKKTGRPTKYTETLVDKFCEELALGRSVHELCKLDEYPSEKTIYNWIDSNESFLQKYARAKERCADLRASEIIHIADTEPDSNKARVMIDARKWYSAKLEPKKYSDKVRQEVTGKDEGPIKFEEVTRENAESFKRSIAGTASREGTTEETSDA